MRGLVLRIAIAATSAAMIVVNLLAPVVRYFGRGTAEVSAMYPTLVTPAGYVFVIWGVIYVGLIALSVAVFLKPLRHDAMPERIAVPLVVSNIANMTWLVLWHSLNIVWSVPVMLVLLGSLIAAYRASRRGRAEHPPAIEYWCVRAPLGMYLAWISVATIANVSNALVAVKWDGFGITPEVWALIVLTAAGALALTVLLREGDQIYAGVFVWALVGIQIASASAMVAAFALVLAIAIEVIALGSLAARTRAA